MAPKNYSYTGVPGANNIISEDLIQPSTFENIDHAFYDFVNDHLDLRAETNKGWKKVPIVWASAERAFFSKEKKELRDLDGTLILPIISVERTSVTKDLVKKGAYYGMTSNYINAYHGSRITVARRIVSDKTNNFAVADNRKKFSSASDAVRTPNRQGYFPQRDQFGRVRPNKKVVYETVSMPIPVYVGMTYTVSLRTEYVQQMNQMLQPIATLGGVINSFLIRKNGHHYETFLRSDLTQANNVASFTDEERSYQSNITFEVLGYLIGEDANGNRPKYIKRENAVKVKIPRERVLSGDDIQQFEPNSGFYRE